MRRALLTAYGPPAGPSVGDPFMGGYYAGIIDTTRGNIIGGDASQAGKRYLLIVSPKSLEATSKAWRAASGGVPSAAMTRWDGLSATAAMNSATYPAAQYCAGLTAPSDGGSGWYLPAMDEMELVYRNLKPTAETNYTTPRSASTFPGGADFVPGVNPSSDPQAASNTATVPGKTGAVAFQEGAAQALGAATGTIVLYWSATESYPPQPNAWGQYVSGSISGAQLETDATSLGRVRPVRRLVL